MTRIVYYRQCKLVRPTQRGEMRQVSWIPERFAVAGKLLRLREEPTWQDGWVVREVGPYRLAEPELPDPHTEVKHHRKASGDALPRTTQADD